MTSPGNGEGEHTTEGPASVRRDAVSGPRLARRGLRAVMSGEPAAVYSVSTVGPRGIGAAAGMLAAPPRRLILAQPRQCLPGDAPHSEGYMAA
jgi:hypothetical protein